MAACVVCSAEIRDDARFCPSCGAEQPSTEAEGDDPFIGRVIARNFKIERLLGVGGMGKVYKARQLSLDKAVVIKVLHDHFRDDPQLVQRFQREARAASRLNHPNSIQVIDFGQDESGVLFMAIEFLNGTDLFTVLQKEGPFSEERIARVMVQVCSALHEAHEMNVIHRDLKPENIMVEDRRGRRDVVKVLDFGIAKIQDPDETPGQALTQAGMVCGTPEYMSPEQARGQKLDARADLYSLGVLVYQMTTGELPFQADSPIGIVTKHIIEPPVPPRQKYPHLNMGEELEGIILKAMAKNADDRYQSAEEMGLAFEAILRRFGEYTGELPLATGGTGTGLPRTTPSPHAAASTPGPQPQAAPSAAQAPAAQTPPPATPAPATASSTMVQPASGTGTGQPALTSPTPTDLTPVADVPLAPTGGGGGLKWAAVVALLVVVLGGGALFAFKDSIMGGGEVTADGDGTGETGGDGTGETGNDPVAKNPDGTGEPAGTGGDKDPSGQDPTDDNNGTAVAATGQDKDPAQDPAGTDPDGAPQGTGDDKSPSSDKDKTAKSDKTKDKDKSAKSGKDKDKDTTRVAKADKDKGKDKDKDTGRKTARDKDKDKTSRDTTRKTARGTSDEDKAKARELTREATTLVFTDPDTAYGKLKEALNLYPRFADPRKIIAMYWVTKSDYDASCKAMRDYIRLKGSRVSSTQREKLLKQARCP